MLFQQYIPGLKNEIIFHVTIGSDKKPDLIDFHHNSPAIEYVQHGKNTCLFSSLAYDMHYSREHVSEKTFDSLLESSLKVNHWVIWIGSNFQ